MSIEPMYQETYNVSPHVRSQLTRDRVSKSMTGNLNKLSASRRYQQRNYIYGLLDINGKVVYVGMTSQDLHTRLLQHYAVSFGQGRPDPLSGALRNGQIHGIRCLHVVESYIEGRTALCYAIQMYDTLNNGFNLRLPAMAKALFR
jgi:hypothetical protein